MWSKALRSSSGDGNHGGCAFGMHWRGGKSTGQRREGKEPGGAASAATPGARLHMRGNLRRVEALRGGASPVPRGTGQAKSKETPDPRIRSSRPVAFDPNSVLAHVPPSGGHPGRLGVPTSGSVIFGSVVHQDGEGSRPAAEERKIALKPSEPHGRLRDATCPRRSSGENRRSREERQGRNEPGGGIPRPKGAAALARRLPGVDARARCRRRGVFGQPQERSPNRSRGLTRDPSRIRTGSGDDRATCDVSP